MMMPSLRNWSTSPISVIPVCKRGAVIQTSPPAQSLCIDDSLYKIHIHILFNDFTAQWVSCFCCLSGIHDKLCQSGLHGRKKRLLWKVLCANVWERKKPRDEPLPMIWLSSILSMSAGISTSLTSSSRSEVIEMLSRGIKGTDRWSWLAVYNKPSKALPPEPDVWLERLTEKRKHTKCDVIKL